MKIIHTVAGLRADHGGPSRSITALADAQSKCGHDVHIVTATLNDPKIQNIAPKDALLHAITYSSNTSRWKIAKLFELQLTELIQTSAPIVIHDHGLWLPTNQYVGHFAQKNKICRVVSPRGMLSAWAMARRKWLKKAVWWAWQGSQLHRATGLHATSSAEAADIKRVGCSQPICVAPNCVNIPLRLPTSQRKRERFRLLCLSRIHPVKGIAELVRAFSRSCLESNWDLVIVGPDEAGYASTIKSLCQELQVGQRIRLVGAVSDDDKWQQYVDADLFVLPSFTENFGLSIAEAMAAGLPVITTTGTPWQVLEDKGLGWWIKPTEEALAVALRQAMSVGELELKRIGKQASDFVRSSFDWHSTAETLIEFYKNLCKSKR